MDTYVNHDSKESELTHELAKMTPEQAYRLGVEDAAEVMSKPHPVWAQQILKLLWRLDVKDTT